VTTEDDFHRLLDQNPEDHHTRLVFADWLQDRNDPRAEGYRALGIHQHRPAVEGGEHRWYISAGNSPHSNEVLPPDWFAALADHYRQRRRPPMPHVYNRTRRGVEDAAALAFSRLPEHRRNEILNGPVEKLSRRTYSRRTGRRVS